MKMSKVGNQTNSQDPQAVNSRVFVGNLNTFQCSKTDVERMFQRYGRLVEPKKKLFRECTSQTTNSLGSEVLKTEFAGRNSRRRWLSLTAVVIVKGRKMEMGLEVMAGDTVVVVERFDGRRRTHNGVNHAADKRGGQTPLPHHANTTSLNALSSGTRDNVVSTPGVLELASPSPPPGKASDCRSGTMASYISPPTDLYDGPRR
ncbi:hypothetical protein QTP88_002181 [Uroleucon formosanum]